MWEANQIVICHILASEYKVQRQLLLCLNSFLDGLLENKKATILLPKFELRFQSQSYHMAPVHARNNGVLSSYIFLLLQIWNINKASVKCPGADSAVHSILIGHSFPEMWGIFRKKPVAKISNSIFHFFISF